MNSIVDKQMIMVLWSRDTLMATSVKSLGKTAILQLHVSLVVMI